MRVHNSKGLNFSISYPDDWSVEEDGNVLSVYDPVNGNGALQFSSYEVNGIDPINLKEALGDYLSDRHEDFKVQELDGYSFCKCDDQKGNQWEYWAFARGVTLIFSSYNCSKEDVGKEDDKINSIVKSVLIKNK
jgi:hypothetical protein